MTVMIITESAWRVVGEDENNETPKDRLLYTKTSDCPPHEEETTKTTVMPT